MFSSIALLSLPLIHGAAAWGNLGHETIAFIAQNFVQNTTQTWAQDILNDTSSSYLAGVATWADTYKYTSAGSFSKPFHFFDAEDNPPASCNVDFDRDCGDAGCVVSAIANYTQRVQSSSLPHMERNYALRFLVHFIGDITQPLHDEAFEVGGNDVDVTFNGESTELHAVWDTGMPEKLVGGYALSDAESWASNLTEQINSGDFSSQKKSWLQGLDISDAKSSAMVWAQDGNSYVCTIVMPNNVTVLEDSSDLYPKYYDSAIDTVELQIAKAGYRLAAWLDALAAKASSRAHKRWEPRDQVWKVGTQGVQLDQGLDGREFLPAPKVVKSKQKLRREAVGWGCGHKH